MGGVPFANTYTLYLLRTNLILLAIGCLTSTPEPMKQFNILCKKECSDRYYNDFVSTGFGYSLSDFQQLQPIPVLLDSKERRNYK